ncbi:MAG: hypothetical protein II750_01720 [Bacteroidaceae bacterium]|nr:hypothetical protein [Bacteroidaceae bacterium]
MKRNLLITISTLLVVLMLTACAEKKPKEQVIDAINSAIERVDEAKTRKKLDCASQMLMYDYKKIFKKMSQAEQMNIMNSSDVVKLQNEFNKRVAEKRKVVR